MTNEQVHAAARESVAAWMIAHSYPTGHGDTLDDLLLELIGHTTASIKSSIDARLNDHLCDMQEGWDDSVSGFNDAWDIVRKAFKDRAASRATPADPALDPATVEAGIARLIAQEFCQASDFKVGGTEIFHVRDWRRAMRVAAGVRFFINEQGSDHAQD